MNEVAICDLKAPTSRAARRNMKSSGNRSGLRSTCSLRRFISTPGSPGRIVCVDPESGEIRWEIAKGIQGNGWTMALWKDYPVARGIWSEHPPAVADGRLFIRGGDGIYCYDLRR